MMQLSSLVRRRHWLTIRSMSIRSARSMGLIAASVQVKLLLLAVIRKIPTKEETHGQHNSELLFFLVILTGLRYLTTLAAAEQLYDALYQWDKQGSIDITDVSLPFFTDLVNNTQTGSFDSSSSEYESITGAVKAYADGFIDIVQAYTPSDGALSEQFSRDSGDQASAKLLTWSFASFLTTVARRNGQVPSSWGSSASEVPSECSGETVAGTYASPSVGSW